MQPDQPAGQDLAAAYAAMRAGDGQMAGPGGVPLGDPEHPLSGDPETSTEQIDGQTVEDPILDDVKQILAAVPGLTVVSGTRDGHDNRIHKGVPGSLHLNGTAVDLAGDAAALQKAAALASKLGATEVSIHNPGGRMIVHLGW